VVYPPVPAVAASETTLRVLLFETRTPVLISLSEGATLTPLDGEAQAEVLPELLDAGVSPITSGILIGERLWPHGRLRLTPTEGSMLTVDGSAYRGSLVLAQREDGSLTGINEVGTEQYLASVVSAELPSRWPLETLKAQAIAARTYALHKARQRAGGLFTLYADTRDQMYRGVASESARSLEAVTATSGVIATFGGRLFPTFYHSTCGGATEPAERVFGISPVRPLSGVNCGFCGDSKYYRWQAELSAAQVRDAVAQAGYNVGDAERIEMLPLERASQYRRVKVIRLDGSEASMPADVFRNALGPSVIRSVLFQAHRSGENLLFEGRGYGHLVGMCQWGARGMGAEGYGADEILAHYYPDVELVKAY